MLARQLHQAGHPEAVLLAVRANHLPCLEPFLCSQWDRQSRYWPGSGAPGLQDVTSGDFEWPPLNLTSPNGGFHTYLYRKTDGL